MVRLAVAVSSTQVLASSGQARGVEEVATLSWERKGWFGKA